MNNTQC